MPRPSRFRLAVALTAWFLAALPAWAADQLVAPGASWKYLDDGTNQGTAWRGVAFDDSTWSQGPAQLGYGDGDEATVVSYGPNASNKYTTTYFRLAFDVVDPSAYLTVTLKLLRDDGAVVYLNGTEVVRSNMPAGVIRYVTKASSAVSGAGENTFNPFTLSPALLAAGSNQLAVEIHQSSGTSSDISFDLELLGAATASVTRGPYLQLGSPTEVTLRWRTDLPTNSRVSYGPSPGNLNQWVDDATVTTEHEVRLTLLAPDSQVSYAVGSSSQVLSGGDADHFFRTAPIAGSSQPTRIWVLGDCGTGDASAAAVRDAYHAFAGATHTNLWLMLGDNAYTTGTDSEYQGAVFDTYPQMLRKSVLWATRGNHDTVGGIYYGVFNLPTAAEAGGLASGTEAYYSFDHANLHVICLDSFGSSRAVGGPMWTWLQADLAATDQEWIVAFWHHPPYSKGSHDSDTEATLIDMRQNFLPLLEAGGIDLVLSGHSHSYERSFLIDGHHGHSSTFGPAHLKDGGDGRPAGNGAYETGGGPNDGAVYCVAGSSGKTGGGTLNHPAMFTSLAVLGSVVLDVDGERMDVAFLDSTGAAADTFTIQHAVDPWSDLGFALAGVSGDPLLTGAGTLEPASPGSLDLVSAAPNATSVLFVSLGSAPVPFKGGTLAAFPAILQAWLVTLGDGTLPLPFVWPTGLPAGTELVFQHAIQDAAAPAGVALSNALQGVTP